MKHSFLVIDISGSVRKDYLLNTAFELSLLRKGGMEPIPIWRKIRHPFKQIFDEVAIN
jgi:hypothetical protein